MLALLAAPVVGALLAVAVILWSWAEGARLVRATQTLSARQSLQDGGPDGLAARLLFSGATLGVAGAAMQATVRRAVEAAGAQLDQLDPAPAQAEGALTRLQLTLSLTATEAQVAQVTAALEGAEPLMFIDRLQLDGTGQDGGVLSARIAVSGYAGPVPK